MIFWTGPLFTFDNMFEYYLDTELVPVVHHSYQTWQSFEQDQKQRRPNTGQRKERKWQITVLVEVLYRQIKVAFSNTMCSTSKVTAYCMFSIDASKTLLSGSSFFPSRPKLNCNDNKWISLIMKN